MAKISQSFFVDSVMKRDAVLAVLEIVFPSNREWAVAWADSGAPLRHRIKCTS